MNPENMNQLEENYFAQKKTQKFWVFICNVKKAMARKKKSHTVRENQNFKIFYYEFYSSSHTKESFEFQYNISQTSAQQI